MLRGGEHVDSAQGSRSAFSSIMSRQEMYPSVAQRIFINLCWLSAQFGDETFLTTQVYDWHKKNSDGREAVENVTHARQPRTSINEAKIRAIRELTESGRHLTVLKIITHVGISYRSAQSIISVDLGYRKVCSRWVLCLSTEEHKGNGLFLCERLLARYEAEGDDWLGQILTCDETWVHR